MDITYDNQGTITYLVYRVSDEDTIDEVSLGMLSNNKIQGLATTVFTQSDNVGYIKYNVSSRISVKQFFQGKVNRQRLVSVFTGIADALLTAEDYMINTDAILLDTDYVFVDVSTCEISLICLPIVEKTSKIDLRMYFKSIMFGTQFDQSENCDYVADIINYLNSSVVFSLVNFKSMLEKTVSKKQPATNTDSQTIDMGSADENGRISQAQIGIGVQNATIPIQRTVSHQNTVQKSPEKVNITYVPPVTKNSTSEIDNANGEKAMSLFGLLMHYSKENKQLYMEQKKRKKENGNKNQTKKKQTESNTFGVVVPGDPTPTVPGSYVTGQQNVIATANQQSTNEINVHTQVPVNNVLSQIVPNIAGNTTGNFGETVVLNSTTIGKTTVLNQSPQEVKIKPHLIRAKNNERINLDKPVFRIGKERSYVDYFVGDNSAISRSHCNIITKNGEFFIVDTNSTNHTYVNGGIVPSNEEVRLAHGTKVRLANEEFEFRLY